MSPWLRIGVLATTAACVLLSMAAGCKTRYTKTTTIQVPEGTVERDSPPTVRPDDEAVVETALLAFFEKSSWNHYYWWLEGDFVVIGPQWLTGKRPNFLKTLDYATEREGGYKEGKPNAAKLRKIRGRIGAAPPKLPAAQPLSEMKLDHRIVIGDALPPPNWDGVSWKDWRVENRNRQTGSIRVMGHLEPPSYSADGQYAMLLMDRVSSDHGAQVTFFLERNDAGWKLIHVMALFHA